MKRLAMVVLILVVSRSSIAQRVERQRPGALQGVVVKAGTNDPVANATVELTGIANNATEFSSSETPGRIAVSVAEIAGNGSVFSLQARTDSKGRFTIRNIPPGTGYHLVAIRWPQYLATEHGQTSAALRGRPLEVSSGQEIRDLRIEMMLSASISGRVLDSRGRGVETQIEVLRSWYPNGVRELVPFQSMDGGRNRTPMMSGGNGRYRIEGLRPGLYYVYAAASANPPTAPTYFPEGLVESTAKPVVLHMGDTRTDIDIRVAKAEELELRGKAIPFDPGTGIRILQVTASITGALPYRNSIPSGSAGNGSFVLRVRYPGTYFLQARTVDFFGRVLWGSKTVEVRDKDIGDIEIPVTPGLDIQGRVVVEGDPAPGALRDLAEIVFVLRPLFGGAPTFPNARLGKDSLFMLRGVPPGEYRVEVVPLLGDLPSISVPDSLGNAFVKSLRLGERDVLSEGLRLDTDDTGRMGAFEMTISFSGGLLDGRILTEGKEPAAGVKAIVIPNSPRRNRGDLYRAAYTDDTGRFQIRGIPPGDYRLFAWEQIPDGSWRDPHLLRLYEDRGAAVHIEEYGYESVDATLIPAEK